MNSGLSANTTHFSLFGLPEHFEVDDDALNAAYRTVQSQAPPVAPLGDDAVAFWMQLTGGNAAPPPNAGASILAMVQQPGPPPPPPAPVSVAELEAKLTAQLF
jgi:hypothetical protein